MKGIVEYITESLVKTKKISGLKKVHCVNREMDVDYSVESKNWNLTTFKDPYYGDKMMAYWSPDSEWIFYKKDDGAWNWAAAAPSDIFPKDFSEAMFNDWDGLCMNGATIPEFDEFKSDLKG